MTTVTTKALRPNVDRPRAGGLSFLQNWSVEKLPDWFLVSSGAILALNGMEQILEVFAKNQTLDLADPIFGIPFRVMLLSFGIVNVAIAALCFFTDRKMLLLCIIVWWTANGVVYRIGLWQMGWTQPYPLVSYLATSLHISVRKADVVLAGVAGYLLTGSITSLVVLKREISEKQFSKMSCPSCGGHIKFGSQNVGQKTNCPHCKKSVTLRTGGASLKMSCFFCQGHIEFPAHALGSKMPCPHCKKDITLVEAQSELK